ncbi:MAG: Ig-like domain-containing protein, partial [Bacteroidales bacterium]|nr:Ig-like domain-containing protein [Bacteroidales bacterium]
DSGTNEGDDRGYLLIPKEYNYVYIPTHVTGISLDRTSANVRQGGTLQLTETVVPANADDKSVTWSTSDPSVATVSSTGLVTVASDAPIGSTVIITATTNDGHYTASCNVTVRNTTVVTLQTNGNTISSTGNNREYTLDGITISFGRVSERGGDYIEYETTSGQQARRRFTVSADGKMITKITLYYSRQNGTVSSNPGTVTDNVWTGRNTTIVFSNTQTNNNNRLSYIEVEYEN